MTESGGFWGSDSSEEDTRQYEQMVDQQDLIELRDKGIWRTKKREEIKIKDMATKHIKNSLRMIQQNNWRIMYEIPLLLEIKRRESEATE